MTLNKSKSNHDKIFDIFKMLNTCIEILEDDSEWNYVKKISLN